jgi:hypothetical protein
MYRRASAELEINARYRRTLAQRTMIAYRADSTAFALRGLHEECLMFRYWHYSKADRARQGFYVYLRRNSGEQKYYYRTYCAHPTDGGYALLSTHSPIPVM